MDAEWFGHRQTEWITRLHRGVANLRAALEFCASTPEEAEAGLAMSAARTAVSWRHAMVTPEGADHIVLPSGVAHLYRGEIPRAAQLLERAVALHRGRGEPCGVVIALVHLAMAMSADGRTSKRFRYSKMRWTSVPSTVSTGCGPTR